jgi:hypothetical protein
VLCVWERPSDQAKGFSLFLLPFPPVPPPHLRVDPPAPLSLSSGGLAGRSEGERGDRPPCAVGSLGLIPGFGALPRWSCSPAPPGGAGRRQDLLPLRRPWWAVVGTGSGHSSKNKPARVGLSPLAQDPALPHRSYRGGGNGGARLDPPAGGLDLLLPVVGKLLSWWRLLQLCPLSSCTRRGGRRWRLCPLPTFI